MRLLLKEEELSWGLVGSCQDNKGLGNFMVLASVAHISRNSMKKVLM